MDGHRNIKLTMKTNARSNPVSVSHSPPKTPHVLSWDDTQATKEFLD